MDFVQPKIINSPMTGAPIKPQLRTYIKGHQEITEACWWDMSNGGTLVHKGTVSIKDLKKK